MATATVAAPERPEQAAELLGARDAEGRPVRIAGAGTKPWSPPPADDELILRTTGLTRILAHDPGDMTATLEAGVPLAAAQARFATAGQMLALDPPVHAGGDDAGDDEPTATVGGIVATADRGPLAHRYGGPRDLVVGATVALADGTIARSGGTVIKNVAGYDVAKLLCGSHGTLGLILSVNVRLHPCRATVTAHARTDDPRRLAAAAAAVARLPAELEALDVAWDAAGGRLLARCGGGRAAPRAERIAVTLRDHGLDEVALDDDDDSRWAAQRAAQRSRDRAVVRVLAPPSRLAVVLGAVAGSGGTLVGRAALGESYVTVDPERIVDLRERLPGGAEARLHDCPARARAAVVDPWGTPSPPVLALNRALKARFDPGRTCNPGIFVGGI
jgi:glycolate oxidase FAD binding subunit